MELSDIDARIAQLKEQIALKEAAQNKVKESYHNPYSKYHYGYIYDAIMGDRSGLDKEAAEDAAYQKLLMEQAQADKIRAEQAYNTAYENDLNRKNALAIAEQNRILGANDKLDELSRMRGRALVNLQYAEAAYKQANAKGDRAAMETAERDIQLAQEDLAYYNKRLGTKIETPKSTEPPKDNKDGKGPVKVEVTIEDLKGINSKNTLKEMETALKQAESHPMKGQDKELESVIVNLKTLIKNKKDYIADEQFIKNWKDGQPFDATKFKRVMAKGKLHLERKK